MLLDYSLNINESRVFRKTKSTQFLQTILWNFKLLYCLNFVNTIFAVNSLATTLSRRKRKMGESRNGKEEEKEVT